MINNQYPTWTRDIIESEDFFLFPRANEFSGLPSNILFNFCLGSLFISSGFVFVDPSSCDDVSTDKSLLFVELPKTYPPSVRSCVTGNFERGNISPVGSLISSSADVTDFTALLFWFWYLARLMGVAQFGSFGAIHRSLDFGEIVDCLLVVIVYNYENIHLKYLWYSS